jgi:hypothetical protein
MPFALVPRFAGSAFKQQTLKAWRPILTPKLVILLFSSVGIIFVPIGAIILGVSNQVVEVTSDDYATSCCIANCGATETWKRIDRNPCDVTIHVHETMKPPVYVYYKLTKYYQNHRRYVRSRDDNQLKGVVRTAAKLSDSDSCKYHVLANASADQTSPSNVINPCGLVAYSVFNDSFALYDSGGAPVALNESGIAWPSDLQYKFKNSDNGTTGQNFPQFAHWRARTCADLPTAAQRTACDAAGLPEAGWCYPGSGYCVEDEHFVVWMRAAGLPDFRKLCKPPARIRLTNARRATLQCAAPPWTAVPLIDEPPLRCRPSVFADARIETEIPAGTYKMQVSNGQLVGGNYVAEANGGAAQTFLYPVSSFGGTKAVVLSTTTWIGGRNLFLGYAYVVVGVVCVVLALCFFIKHRLTQRALGDADYIQAK